LSWAIFNENDPVRQAARSWSGRLGNLAATSPIIQSEATFPQPDTALPARLSSILTRLQHRAQRREHTASKLRANEFLTGQ